MAAPYSGLEVVPPEQAGLEHYSRNDAQAGLEYDPVKGESPYFKNTPIEGPIAPHEYNQRICGLSRRAFWIIVPIVAVVVVAAAVGGGVGGSLSSKKTATTTSASASSSSTATATSSSSSATSSVTTGPITASPTSTPALTTTQVIGPSTTLLSDCPSSNNTLYGITLGDDTLNFRKICGMSYLNDISGGDVVNTRTTSLDDCINLCAAYNLQNATAIREGTNSVCNAVCWRNTFINDDFPGQCFGFTTTNSSNAFVIHNETICDSAAWIDQQFL